MRPRGPRPKPLAESTARSLSTEALVAIERDLTRELDAAFASGTWKEDPKEHEKKQGLLNEVREELYHRDCGGEKVG